MKELLEDGYYTGLRDRHGNKIHTGQRVRDRIGEGIVGYCPPGFTVCTVIDGQPEHAWLGGGLVYPMDAQLRDTEIVPRPVDKYDMELD